jgi:hypothetical protein
VVVKEKPHYFQRAFSDQHGAEWLSVILIAGFLVLNIFPTVSAQAHRAFPPATAQQEPDCPQIFSQLSLDSTIQFLANPILTTQTEIDRAVQYYTAINECLTNIPDDDVPKNFQQAKALLEYFLIFTAENYPDDDRTNLELVEFINSENPAVIQLRDRIGLPAPPGFIFIQYYPSRRAMPELVAEAFTNPQVAGVTILSRYIAILDEPTGNWAEQFLQSQSLSGTYNHELVHAYINALLYDSAPPQNQHLPKWFEEGLANYISGSGKVHTVITPDLALTQTSTEEYHRYELYFRFLESRLGQDKLNAKIKAAVLAGDGSLLYSELGIANSGQLESLAIRWRDRQMLARSAVGGLALVLILGFLYTRLPEYECTCGFLGKKRDFSNNRCPDCGSKFREAQQVRMQTPTWIAPSCQICGKRFSPWRRGDLNINQHRVRVWTPARPGTDVPQSRFVKRVCRSCLERGHEIQEMYYHQMQMQILEMELAIRPDLAAWLDDAPKSQPRFVHTGQIYTSKELLDLLVLAWLDQRLGPWLDKQSAFLFTGDELPVTYQDILISKTGDRLGSVFKIDRDSFMLEWHNTLN